MSRLVATMGHDGRLQARNHVYVIVGIATLLLAVPLRVLLTAEQVRFFMPLLALSGVGLTAFFLVSVLMLLERGEGTLDAVAVSPLRPSEYLASKIATVTALALIEGVAIAGIAFAGAFSLPWLALAVVMRAAFVAAVGIAVAVRYQSITRFLFPAVGLTVLFDGPVLFYLELWPSSIFYLWPTLPPLLLAKAAFVSTEPLELVYACGFGAASVAAAWWWAQRSIERFVVRGEPLS